MVSFSLTLSRRYTEGIPTACRKWFTIVSIFTGPVLFVINAPFGRFTLNGQSIFLLDGVKSWIVMELVSPLTFIFTFLKSPLSQYEPVFELSFAQYILAGAYLTHYLNRAIISPLRTPSRSKSHIIVPFSGVLFNVLNGSLIGTYLSLPAASVYLSRTRPSFFVGLSLWAIGFAGNIIHDEILLNIRRKANSKSDGKTSRISGSGKTAKGNEGTTSEHYAIPYGLLYKYISYPNYFCEWIEWFGFALAASPLPFAAPSLSDAAKILSFPAIFLESIWEPSSLFAPKLTPPWIFILNEIVLMLPRAYKGHRWYHEKFGNSYPKERKVVVPFV
ncbi:hypothetical protein FB446DRAFT_802982, partial [Lentinula raphanica]